MSKRELLLKKIKENNGIITTREALNLGIHKDILKELTIKKELEKLLLYCDDKKIITREDIELLATRSLEYDVFSLTNELFGKNYSKLRVVYNSLVLKKEEPIFLLSLISGQLRMYYKVKVLLNEHYSQKDKIILFPEFGKYDDILNPNII